jgi:hypothetical protein
MAHQNKWSGQILSISEKPIISVKEARKILGKEYNNVSNDNLMGIIKSLTQIAEYYLDSIKVPKTT